MPVCPNCSYKHDFWDASLMRFTYLNSKPFIEIEGCYHKGKDGCVDVKKITRMFGCPQCHTVFWIE